MHAVHTPQTSSHSEGCKQTQACSPACQPLFLRWSAAQHAVLCTHPPAALHVLLCCRLQLPASCLPHAPDVLYVVLYSGQLLQDAAPLLVVPLAVAQELQALFEDMQQQPAADGTEPTEEQAAGHAQVTCCSWWRAGTCRGRSSCADAHSVQPAGMNPCGQFKQFACTCCRVCLQMCQPASPHSVSLPAASAAHPCRLCGSSTSAA